MRTHLQKIVWLVAPSAVAVVIAGPPRRADAQVDFTIPPRPVDVARYTTAFQCLNAVENAQDSGMLTVSGGNVFTVPGPDTSVADPAKPARPGVVAAAQQCVRTLPSVARINPEELPTLRRIALFAGNDSLAITATERQLTLPENATKPYRNGVLMSAVWGILGVPPTRLALAKRYLDQLDATRDHVFMLRVSAHMEFVKHVQASLDLDAFAVELKAMHVLAQDELAAGGPQYTEMGTALTFVTRVLEQRLAILRRGPIAAMNNRTAADSLLRGSLIGTKMPSPPATYWFRKGSATVPTPGKVTYVVGLSKYNNDDYPAFAALRRYARAFPDVEIVIVARTWGLYRGELAAPAAEAERLRARLHDTLSLPGTLGVVTVPVTKRPAPDNRIDYQIPGWISGSGPSFGPVGYLVLPDGRIADQVTLDEERMLHALTKAILADPAIR